MLESDDIENTEVGSWVYLLTAAVAISGLLFGYDTGYISGALVVIGDDLGRELSNQDKSFITSVTSIGALFGALLAGGAPDMFGRKWVIGAADIIFIIGALTQATAHGLWVMVLGRFVIGIGVGLASLITPLYLAELAPAKLRGRLIVVNVFCITLGQVTAFTIGAGLDLVSNGWRHIIWIGAIPATIQCILLYWLPETPRYLIRVGNIVYAHQVIQRTYPSASSEEVDAKVSLIEQDVVSADHLQGYVHLRHAFIEIFKVPSNLRAVVIACGLQAFQQLCAFNTLMYFASTIFQLLGFDNPTATGLLTSGTNMIFTVIAFFLIDCVGRRRILLYTIPVMSCGLVLASVGFHQLPLTSTLDSNGPKDPLWGVIILIAMATFVAAYATGIGNVPWQQSEFFPMRVRGIGVTMSTATNWSANFLLSSTFLLLLDAITPAGTFAVYAGICGIGWLFVLFIYPETSGLSIEDVSILLRNDFGVRKSSYRQLAQADKRRQKKGKPSDQYHESINIL